MAKNKFYPKGNNINFKSLINNKYILYLVSLIVFFLIIQKIINKQFIDIFVFYIVAFLMFMYTKNMTLVLLIAVIITYLFSINKKSFLKEGLQNKREGHRNNQDDNDAFEFSEQGF